MPVKLVVEIEVLNRTKAEIMAEPDWFDEDGNILVDEMYLDIFDEDDSFYRFRLHDPRDPQSGFFEDDAFLFGNHVELVKLVIGDIDEPASDGVPVEQEMIFVTIRDASPEMDMLYVSITHDEYLALVDNTEAHYMGGEKWDASTFDNELFDPIYDRATPNPTEHTGTRRIEFWVV